MNKHTGASERAADPSQETRRVGRCVIFGELARGGMATVYLGRWIGSGGFHRTVAVKALHPALAS
ncbi:MAG TPA: hypothetical protein VFB62_24655, partial [Polyangiaceae bacterium]|nr:hypothetical protein [Polyangiaceae bacterium]